MNRRLVPGPGMVVGGRCHFTLLISRRFHFAISGRLLLEMAFEEPAWIPSLSQQVLNQPETDS